MNARSPVSEAIFNRDRALENVDPHEKRSIPAKPRIAFVKHSNALFNSVEYDEELDKFL